MSQSGTSREICHYQRLSNALPYHQAIVPKDRDIKTPLSPAQTPSFSSPSSTQRSLKPQEIQHVGDMCVANLSVSTQPCSHRWYELVRSCSDERNLANCPDRLKLEGWESRKEVCPWCDRDTQQMLTDSTHRLFGSTSSAFSTPSATVSSPISPLLGATRQQRSGSGGTLSSLHRANSNSSAESDRIQAHRERNDRFHLYLNMAPHEVLPSASKYYPTSPREESPATSDCASIMSRSGRLSKHWRKSVRWSRSMFGG